MRDKVDELLTRGVTEAIVREELERKLREGKTLRVKFGIDPTGPLIHLGRAVPLLKLRAFQDLGHLPIIIIGDFTGRVGDASDKDAERRMLDRTEVEKNMQGYLDQIGRILDMENIEIRYNSDWLASMSFEEATAMADNFSVAEMLARENFIKRYEGGKRISLREFLYPLMQGYDSVAVRADVELGGNDQLFNLLAGRTIQKAYGQEPQAIMTFGMLEGTDGRKMSTTYDNFIAIVDPPDEQFGKVMRLKDELIITYFELCTDMPMEQIAEVEKELAGGLNPMEAKLLLADTIVTLYHDSQKAVEAHDRFIQVFRKREIPEDVPTLLVKEGTWALPVLLATLKLTTSRSEAGRLIRSGAVRINGERELSIDHTVVVGETEILLQVGKRRMAKVSATHEVP